MLPQLISNNMAFFPDPHRAPKEGLLAYGGDLSPLRLIYAYAQGIFPWYNESSPILWWSPDPRCIILSQNFRIPQTVQREIKKSSFTISMNTSFKEVVTTCADVHSKKQSGTWLIKDMQSAYIELYKLGFAHSIEIWNTANVLVGGIYGVALGKAFFGESMFHIEPNASKFALVTLAQHLWNLDFHFIDCQMNTQHILRYGATMLPRKNFIKLLKKAVPTKIVLASIKNILYKKKEFHRQHNESR